MSNFLSRSGRPRIISTVRTVQSVTVQDSYGWPCTLSALERETQIETHYSAISYPSAYAMKLDPVQYFFPGKIAVNALVALGILLACGVLCESFARRRRFALLSFGGVL